MFVDRWDRKKIMIVSDLIRGALVLGFLLVKRPEDVWTFFVLAGKRAADGGIWLDVRLNRSFS